MDINPLPDGAGGPEDRIPVTVMLTPASAARLEVLTAELRALDPSIDDNDVVDAVFDTGLCAYAYDAPFNSMRPAK